MRHTRPAVRIRPATRSTSPIRMPRRAPPATRAGGRARAARRSSAGAGGPVPAAGRSCARARAGDGPTRGRASRPASRSAQQRDLADGRDPALRGASPPSRGPTPHSRSTGSGCRNSSSRSAATTSRPSGLATALATLARNFVRATPTVIGRPTSLTDAPTQPRRDLDRRPRDVIAARGRRGTPRRSTAPRPPGRCPRTPRTPPCSPPSRPPSAAARPPPRGTGRRAAAPPIAVRTPQRLGLVARGEHDAGADDHRAPAQRGSSRCSTEA